MKELIVMLLSLVGTSLALADSCCAAGAKPAGVDSAECEGCEVATADCNLVGTYTAVSSALAADDLATAQAAAEKLACWASCHEQAALAAHVEAFAKAGSIKEARDLFKVISAAAIPLAKDEGAHFVMTCPMARADWIQTDKEVANPYYGASMLRCGGVKETVAAIE